MGVNFEFIRDLHNIRSLVFFYLKLIMIKISMILVFGLVLTAMNVAGEEDCSYDDAIFCLPEISDIVFNCMDADGTNIEQCVTETLGNGNDCIPCVCSVLEMLNICACECIG